MKKCTLGIPDAPVFAADFPPEMSEFYQRTHRVCLKNLNTSDKKSSRKIKHKKIPGAHKIKKENSHERNSNAVWRRRIFKRLC